MIKPTENLEENIVYDEDNYEPNEETIAVLERIEKGIGLHRCKDFDDFIKQMKSP
jgi:hypothetical protein